MERQDTNQRITQFVLLMLGICILIASVTTRAQAVVSDDPAIEPVSILDDPEDVWGSVEDTLAQRQYAQEGAKITPWLRGAGLPSADNAALVYYQAFVARPERDDATAASFDNVLAGGEPDSKVRAYLGRCRDTIRLAEIAGQIPQCMWGLSRPDGSDGSTLVVGETRQLAFVLAVDARTLALDGHDRSALARCVAIRQLARHIGDDTFLMLLDSDSVETYAHARMRDILGILLADTETLRWLRAQLATIDRTPRSLAQVFERDFELALDQMRWDTTRLAEIREQWPAETSSMTDEQIVDRARQLRQPFQEAVQTVLASDMPYELKQAELEKLASELEAQYADDGLSQGLRLWAATPGQIIEAHDLHTRVHAYANAITIATAIYLEFAEMGRLPETLPEHMPKDPFNGCDFEYELTTTGFLLRRHVVDPTQDKLWEYEFTVRH